MFHKFNYFAVSIILIILFSFVQGCEQKINTQDGLANLTFDSVQGDTVTLVNGKQWLIINYWASWCSPCREEIVELNKLFDTYASKINLIGVTLEPLDNDILSHAVKDLNIHYPIITNDVLSENFNVDTEAFPTTYIIDNDNNKLVTAFYGPVTYQQLVDVIDLKD